ncbi:acetoacetate decarboxylase family protein [Luteolibacter marinus]|uniref:acetoacetate decarboxylase family protein n=1 Tax=Luteolibacter marinus TaxID=2776705 RepID=UPI0018673080|nr:acetoacetate decarboxylase family protein [Luteolibacter marinus]
MIPYTERDTDLNFRPPYRITGVEGLAAVRRIHMRETQQWLDDTLNWRPDEREPSPEFTALPFAFVVFMKMASMRSLDPLHEDWGAVSESEMVVTLPVVAWDNRGLPSLPTLKFYPIVLCLDSSPAMISGREVFGFPKILGEVDIGPEGGEARCEVAVRPGDPVTHRNRRLLKLARIQDGPAAAPPASYGGGLVEMVKDELLADFDELWLDHLAHRKLLRGVLNKGLEWLVDQLGSLEVTQEFVFLKQFRDVARPAEACHRSVATSALTFSNLTELMRESGEWELDVPELRSSDLLNRIGLESGPIGAPLRSAFNFDLSLGTQLWST